VLCEWRSLLCALLLKQKTLGIGDDEVSFVYLQAGSATFYVTEPAALAAAPHLLQRLKAAGALPIVLAKVLQDSEQLQLAVQLDPQHLTRNIKAQQCVHMFNVYSESAAGSLTYLHQVRSCHLHSCKHLKVVTDMPFCPGPAVLLVCWCFCSA
jgi:hypothetical protein